MIPCAALAGCMEAERAGRARCGLWKAPKRTHLSGRLWLSIVTLPSASRVAVVTVKSCGVAGGEGEVLCGTEASSLAHTALLPPRPPSQANPSHLEVAFRGGKRSQQQQAGHGQGPIETGPLPHRVDTGRQDAVGLQ